MEKTKNEKNDKSKTRKNPTRRALPPEITLITIPVDILGKVKNMTGYQISMGGQTATVLGKGEAFRVLQIWKNPKYRTPKSKFEAQCLKFIQLAKWYAKYPEISNLASSLADAVASRCSEEYQPLADNPTDTWK